MRVYLRVGARVRVRLRARARARARARSGPHLVLLELMVRRVDEVGGDVLVEEKQDACHHAGDSRGKARPHGQAGQRHAPRPAGGGGELRGDSKAWEYNLGVASPRLERGQAARDDAQRWGEVRKNTASLLDEEGRLADTLEGGGHREGAERDDDADQGLCGGGSSDGSRGEMVGWWDGWMVGLLDGWMVGRLGGCVIAWMMDERTCAAGTAGLFTRPVRSLNAS